MPATRIIWGDAETDLLVTKRRRRNEEYHARFRGNKTEFWRSVARRIYKRYNHQEIFKGDAWC